MTGPDVHDRATQALLGGLAFLAVVGAGVVVTDPPRATGRTPTTQTPTTTVDRTVDSVVTSIWAETDCADLQAAFDRADAAHDADLYRDRLDLAKVATEYMAAADDRMADIGCYD